MNAYDVVLFGDMPDLESYSRSTSCHRLASELRLHGYSVLVIELSNIYTVRMILNNKTFTKNSISCIEFVNGNNIQEKTSLEIMEDENTLL